MDTEIISHLPVKKYPTLKEIIYLVIFLASFTVGGWMAKGWFVESHQQVMDAIATSDQLHKLRLEELGNRLTHETDAQTAELKAHAGRIEAVRHYGWSNADMARWASQLDKANRANLPNFNVPDVPPPAATAPNQPPMP